jgi:hypothetical protein
LLIVCILTGLIACSDDTKVCDVDVRTEVRARFRYKPPTAVERDTLLPKVTLYAFDKDSIYRKQTGLRGMQFSLDRLADSTRFYFQTDSTAIADTLIFRYKRQPKFVSAGCGVILTYAIDSVVYTKNRIKSISINKNIVTTGNETNLTLNF